MKPKNVIQMWLRRMGVRVPVKLLDSATRDMRALAQQMTPSDVVLDLGAHIGNATTEFAKVAKHVHAFEPNPAIYQVLVRQTARYRNVTLHNKAISDSTQWIDLYFEETKPGKFFEGATIMAEKTNISYNNKVSVQALDIGEFLASLAEPVTLIKMDIEGAEYRVLERLMDCGHMDSVRKIYVECHVDRIPDLQKQKDLVVARASQLGQLDKLNFDWQ